MKIITTNRHAQAKSVMTEFLNSYRKLGFKGKQRTYFDWVLNNGTMFTDKHSLTKFERMGQCYYNSQLYAIGKPKVKYYEGWAICDGVFFPLEHGFNIVDNKVYDLTWADGLVYFGIHIPTNFIVEHHLDTGMANNLLCKYAMSILEK